MLKVSLVNMPFAAPQFPSIALTQLKAVAESRCGEQVRVRILYLNHDFAHYLGVDVYQVMHSVQASNAGLGDWLYRSLAFPEQPDNADEYFQRYYPQRDPVMELRRRTILSKRAGLERFMQSLVARYQLGGEDLVGFTTMFAQNTASFALARLIKKSHPAVTTLLGGANCESPMGEEIARHVSAIDYVFSGPALVSFPDFLERRLAGDTEACDHIRGVFSRRTVDGLQRHETVGQELPIDVPVPLDYDGYLADMARNFPPGPQAPRGRIEPWLLFETSRGCWWGERAHCTFCGLNGGTMAYRGMPPAQAIRLFEEMFAKYGDRCRRFDAVDNIMPREYLTEVFPHVKAPAGVSLFYEVKADLKDHEMEVLGKAGVTLIQPGIESLNTGTLKLMHKGVTSFQNIRFLKNCLRYGISPMWNLLIGFPGEKDDVYRKYVADMPLLAHLPPPSGAYPVRFDRYSPYFTKAAEYGLNLSPYDFYRFVYPFPEESLARLAYFFEDRNYAAQYLSTMVSWRDKLDQGTGRWNERWNGSDARPKAVLALEPRVAGGAGAMGGVIRDTRSGQPVVHEIDGLERAILVYTDANGRRLADIARHCGAGEPATSAKIDRLRRLGLLFEEDDRMISVVILPFEQAADEDHAVTVAGASLPAAAAAGAPAS